MSKKKKGGGGGGGIIVKYWSSGWHVLLPPVLNNTWSNTRMAWLGPIQYQDGVLQVN